MIPRPLLLLPTLLLLGCMDLPHRLARGDGTWQVLEYELVIHDGASGTVVLDHFEQDAGTLVFWADYWEERGQEALVDLDVPYPFYPQGPGTTREMVPAERWVHWETGSGPTLYFSWGSAARTEGIELEGTADGFVGTSTMDFEFGIADHETWEQRYVLAR